MVFIDRPFSCSGTALARQLRGVLLVCLSDAVQVDLVDEDWPMTLGGPVPSCPGLEVGEGSAVPEGGVGPRRPVQAVDAVSGVDGERVSVADGGGTEF